MTAVATKTTEKPAAAKTASNAVEYKGTKLRRPQVRLLIALKGELTRKDWAEAANVDNACCTEYVGSLYDDVRTANDEKYFPSLISLGLVTAGLYEMEDGSEQTYFSLTKEGKKLVNKINA